MISIHSDNSDNNYIPRSPAYEPDSSGPNPVQEAEDPTPGEEAPEDQESGSSRTVISNIFSDSRDSRDNTGVRDASARPRSPLGRGLLMQRVSSSQGYRTEKEEFSQNKAYVNFYYL